MIYLDHIPDNFLGRFTIRNFGFSDAAEIFVFVSGYTAGIVYGRAAASGNVYDASVRAVRRGIQIYLAHILLFVAFVSEVYVLAHGRMDLLDYANTAVILNDPYNALLQALILRYAPMNLDALPFFVVMHLALPAILWGMLRAPAPALLASIGLYASARYFGWAISAYPAGSIYFNPLNWQLLFVVGVCCGMKGLDYIEPVLGSRAFAIVCLIFIAASAAIVQSWQSPTLQLLVPDSLASYIYPIDKSTLAPLRLLHFLALAALCWRWMPNSCLLNSSPVLRVLLRCGEYSLPVFCFSVLFAFAAHTASIGLGSSVMRDLLASGIGLVVLSVIASLFAAFDRNTSPPPRPT